MDVSARLKRNNINLLPTPVTHQRDSSRKARLPLNDAMRADDARRYHRLVGLPPMRFTLPGGPVALPNATTRHHIESM